MYDDDLTPLYWGQHIRVRQDDGCLLEGDLVCGEDGEPLLDTRASGEKVGLLCTISAKDGRECTYVGETVAKARNGRLLVDGSDVAYLPRQRSQEFESDTVYLVRYTPVYSESNYLLAARVTALVGKDNERIAFSTAGLIKAQIVTNGTIELGNRPTRLVAFEGGAVLITDERPKPGYDPAFVSERMLNHPVFVRVRGEEARVCGFLSRIEEDSIIVSTGYDQDGRRISCSDLEEVRYFGHITALSHNPASPGGLIDKTLRFLLEEHAHSQKDRNSIGFRKGQAVSFRLVRSGLDARIEVDDVMLMEESSAAGYAVSGSDESDPACRFGEDPLALFGQESGRRVYLPKNTVWMENTVYRVNIHRAYHAELDAEWLDTVWIRLDEIKHLKLNPPEDGYTYAIARRFNDRKRVQLTRSILLRNEDNPQEQPRAIPVGVFEGLKGGQKDVAAFNSTAAGFQRVSYLIRYQADKTGGVVPGTVTIVQSLLGYDRAWLRFRGGREQPLLLYDETQRQKQNNPLLLDWAFNGIALPVDVHNDLDYARYLLDSPADIPWEDWPRMAKARYAIWKTTRHPADLKALQDILANALTAIGDRQRTSPASFQQEQAQFLYMLALRVNPAAPRALSHFLVSSVYPQDPQFKDLLDKHTPQGVTAAIMEKKVPDAVFDALIVRTILLLIPLSFDEQDVFSRLALPASEAQSGILTALLSGMAEDFRARYQARLAILIGEPMSQATPEELIQMAVQKAEEQCRMIQGQLRDYRNYQPDKPLFEEIIGKNVVLQQFPSLMRSIQQTRDNNLYHLRKASFDAAFIELKKRKSYQYTCLQRLLYPDRIASEIRNGLISAERDWIAYTKPTLAINGCDVIGYRDDGCLHLRISITNGALRPVRQPAENVSLHLRCSEDYEILQNTDDTPFPEQSVWDRGGAVSGSVKIDLTSPFPPCRSELGVDFLLKPANPNAVSWTLTAQLTYSWPWDLPDAAEPQGKGQRGKQRTHEWVLQVSRLPQPEAEKLAEEAGAIASRANLFTTKIDQNIQAKIRTLKADDPRRDILEKIYHNRDKDVEEIVDVFRDPVYENRLRDDAPLVILQGQWRVGKTTVLNRIQQRIRQIDPHAVVILMSLNPADVRSADINTSGRRFAKDFLEAFAGACQEAGQDPGSRAAEAADTFEPIELRECSRLLRNWKRDHPDVRVVLLLDEFTNLYNDMRKGLAYRADLKELVGFLKQLLTVAVGGEFTARMLSEMDGNAIQKDLKILNLTYMNQEQVYDFARYLIGEERLPEGSEASRAALDRLYTLTRGSLFLLQKFCVSLANKAKASPKETMVLTNRWIDQAIYLEAKKMRDNGELEKTKWFDFLWNPFNEDREDAAAEDRSPSLGIAPVTIDRLSDDRVRDDYRLFFDTIIAIADLSTHTFQKDKLKSELTGGTPPRMTEDVFHKRFSELVDNRRVLESVSNSSQCFRISVDLCYSMLSQSQ